MSTRFPGHTVSSYVDDWTLRDSSGIKLVEQIQYVRELAEKLGLKISVEKSLLYATTTDARKHLSKCLKEGLRLTAGRGRFLVDSGKSLGYEFQSRAAKVTSLTEKRVTSATPKMQKLKVMPWSHAKKALILLRGIYPAMLYGCEFHDMGACFFRKIRSLCTGAVWKGRQYVSHYLTPTLSTPVKYEPWKGVVQRCFQSFLRLIAVEEEKTRMTWNVAVKRPAGKHPVGPLSGLVGHFRKLGWTVDEDFKCVTQRDFTFDLCKITTWQFKQQILCAWPDWLVPKLRAKSGLSDLQKLSIPASKYHNDSHCLDGFIAVLQSGGLFTNRVKAKIAETNKPECKLCGHMDGMLHSLYHCCQTACLREGADWDLLKSLPKATMVGGLFHEHEELERYLQLLDNIPPSDIPSLPVDHEMVYIFADGSSPSKRCTERRAAWAFRVCDLDKETSSCVSSGILPGRKQTAYRGELFAVLCALTWARKATVYTDCKGIWSGFQRLLQMGWQEVYWRTSPDLDLWRTGWNLLKQHGRVLNTHWTPAHRKVSEAVGLETFWELVNNFYVDKDASIDKHPWPDDIQRFS